MLKITEYKTGKSDMIENLNVDEVNAAIEKMYPGMGYKASINSGISCYAYSSMTNEYKSFGIERI